MCIRDSKCHQHIALLPGTDGALALGLMHELITQDGLDHDYIERHVQGWPALHERALQWPPQRAAAVCGITADEVRRLARDYAQTRPAAIQMCIRDRLCTTRFTPGPTSACRRRC